MCGCKALPHPVFCLDNDRYSPRQISKVFPISGAMASSGQCVACSVSRTPCSRHSYSSPRGPLLCLGKNIRVNWHEVLLTNRCWLFIFPLFPCEDLQLVQLFISVFFWKLELSFCRLWLFCWPFVSVQVFFLMESTRGELNLSTNQDVLTSYSLFLRTNSHIE